MRHLVSNFPNAVLGIFGISPAARVVPTLKKVTQNVTYQKKKVGTLEKKY